MWNLGKEFRTSLQKRVSICNLGILWLAVLLVSLTVVGCGAGEAVAGAETHSASGAAASPSDTPSSLSGAKSEPLIPEELGTVDKRFGEDSEPPRVFVIGESHVNLEVQQAVRKTLEYLHGAFGVKVIASEGFDGSLPLPASFGSQSAQYTTAMAEFLGRNINAVEFVALTYPELEVYGVSEMEAYLRHGEVLEDLKRRSEQWPQKFQGFIEKEVATLRVSERKGQRIVEALRSGLQSGDLSEFEKRLCEVVGSNSSTCQKAKALSEERAEVGELYDIAVAPDNALMHRRDQGLTANTLGLTAKGPVVLVVGYYHLPGVERELEKKDVAYWAIVPPGVEEPVHSEDDEQVYQRWSKEIPTEFEKWLKGMGHKPPPALSREGFQRRVEIFNALALSDHLLLAGQGEEGVKELMSRGSFPEGFSVERCFQIQGGHGIEFTAQGRTGYAYFTDGPPPKAPGYEEIKRHELPDGRSVVIYDGGSGEPPTNGPTLGLADPGDRDPLRRVFPAIDKQQETRPEAVTVGFWVDGNRVFRFVNKRLRVLPVSPAWIRERRRRLDERPPTRRKLHAAQKLAKILLVDIEEDLPSGTHSVLHQVSEPDLPGSYSLVTLAELGNHPSADRLRDFIEVYWSELDNPDLEEVLATPSRPVEIDKTVVWVADSLRSNPEYDRLVGTIEQTGARLNAPVTEGETLLLVGRPDADWVATLEDGSARQTGTEELRRDLGEASAVVALSAALSEKDSSGVRRLHQLQVTAEQALEAGGHWIEAIAQESGRKPLDRVLREETPEKTVELRELLAAGGDAQSILESSSLVAEHATKMKRV